MSGPLVSPTEAQARLEELARELRAAAEHYRGAWRAHRRGLEAWYLALAGITSAFAEGSPPAVRVALEAFHRAAEEALLLQVEVGDDEALRHMEQGSQQLEAVAQAAEHVAQALRQEAALQ